MSIRDLERLAPFAIDSDFNSMKRSWASSRLNGFSDSRMPILSDLLPDFQPNNRRLDFYWERIDRHGFAPHHMETVTDVQRARLSEVSRKTHDVGFVDTPVSDFAEKSIRDLVTRCRAEGIAVALFWAPESVTYRSWYSPESRAIATDFERLLVEELGVTIFPSRDNNPDTDFIDGYHMLRHGAESYSRWLAETHLKSWLKQPRGDR